MTYLSSYPFYVWKCLEWWYATLPRKSIALYKQIYLTTGAVSKSPRQPTPPPPLPWKPFSMLKLAPTLLLHWRLGHGSQQRSKADDKNTELFASPPCHSLQDLLKRRVLVTAICQRLGHRCVSLSCSFSLLHKPFEKWHTVTKSHSDPCDCSNALKSLLKMKCDFCVECWPERNLSSSCMTSTPESCGKSSLNCPFGSLKPPSLTVSQASWSSLYKETYPSSPLKYHHRNNEARLLHKRICKQIHYSERLLCLPSATLNMEWHPRALCLEPKYKRILINPLIPSKVTQWRTVILPAISALG